MKQCRILQVVYSMNRGGVESWLMHVFRGIDRSRFQMDFVTHSIQEGDFDQEIRNLGGRLFRCPHPSRFIQHAREFSQILREQEPYHVVHSHDPMWDGVAMVLAAKAKVPIRIVHSHNDISRYLSENIFKRLYFKASISVGKKNSTSGLACSELAGASYFGRHWKQDRRWSLLLCGEDLSAFQHSIDRRAVRYELGFHGDVFVVGHVGSFRSEQKNHSFIIRIFADIARVDKRARLLFVGDGSLRPRIEKEVRKMGLADLVVFAGSRDDVPRLLVGAMDLFLFPSRFEGLGLVLVEAQAAGLPSVCSDVIPEEADLGTGLVKKVSLDRSPSEWVQEIIAHRNFCSRISREAAFETVERSRFNLKRSMNELQDIYLGENAIRMSRQMHDEKK